MMKMKGTLQLFTVAALVTLGANAAHAAEIAAPGSTDDTHELRIMNNSTTPVRVYVQDAAGRLHRLARVARAETAIMEVPAEIAADGPFRVKVLSAAPAWSPWSSDKGIRTRDLDLPDGTGINLWLETDLQNSKVEITQH